MKQVFMINFIAVVICLVSCGNSKKQETNDSSTGMQQTEEEVNANSAKTFVLTKNGVGSLQIKQPFKDMSTSDEGLYNKVKKEPYYDEQSMMTFQTYTLYLDDVQVADFMLEKQSSPIEILTITSPNVNLKNGVKIGMPLREAVTKEGIKATIEYDGMLDQGVLYISYGKKLYINFRAEDVELNELTEKAKAKALALTANGNTEKSFELEGKSIQLTPEDFKPEAKVIYFYIDRRFEE